MVLDNGRIDLQPSAVVMAANAQDIATALAFAVEHKLYFTVKGGDHSGTGIPGFMLGGGLSFVSRSYGLSIDNLIDIDIVTPDGKLRTVSANAGSAEERELFWACCGGGGL
jgi:FAD/FMN-containing dehydrogenase